MPLVEITIIEGRTSSQKSDLITQVTDAVENAISAPRKAIRVAIRELPAEHWAIGGVSIAEIRAAQAEKKAPTYPLPAQSRGNDDQTSKDAGGHWK
ncbi:2-hydroxymuconate tautomerase [Maritalea porphyrae]|jgi:4-oxalocrotonate tautomerase|uniref:2-hydroxymuconate tautomerase n=1 Tax=Maritalea porphyrae TaxID=880732 RepID=UPI0022AEDFF2|nr:2-hydroxymuconate tautomerase [Maritalea porphyrae]MCZ4274119.1 2-hydroxymuconate tautomerase family protein [Maritalea porphyrae]